MQHIPQSFLEELEAMTKPSILTAAQQKKQAHSTMSYQVVQHSNTTPVSRSGEALSIRLQDIARLYIHARRRSGEALLEAARWMSEARKEAKHGEWQYFLKVTATSPDTAERLINIHNQATQNSAFADAIRNNWLSQSAAALLARPSTPPELILQVLEVGQSVSTTELQKRIKQHNQKPQIAEYETHIAQEQQRYVGSSYADHDQATELLHEIVISLEDLQSLCHILLGNKNALQQLKQAEALLRAIQRNVGLAE